MLLACVRRNLAAEQEEPVSLRVKHGTSAGQTLPPPREDWEKIGDAV